MQTPWHTDTLTCKHLDMQTPWHEDRHPDMQTPWHADTLACRHSDTETTWHADRDSLKCTDMLKPVHKDMELSWNADSLKCTDMLKPWHKNIQLSWNADTLTYRTFTEQYCPDVLPATVYSIVDPYYTSRSQDLTSLLSVFNKKNLGSIYHLIESANHSYIHIFT